MTYRHLVCLGCLLVASGGCMATRLQNNSDDAAVTVGSLQQQQVLDNLAMFVYDPNSLPYFSYPNQGTAIVSDQEAAGATPSLGRIAGNGTLSTVQKTVGGTSTANGQTVTTTNNLLPAHLGDFMLTALGFSTSGQVTNQQSFTLTPINDPRKLELMRCAYQLAISRCGCRQPANGCPDCQSRFNTFYTGDPDGNIQQTSAGTVTSECLKSPYCWFHVGCKKDVPKHCECTPVGHYCGVYVWVTCEGRDELSMLTLAILDYALHDPPVRLNKQVSYYVDVFGLPTLQKDAVGTVNAQVGINERPESLLNIPEAEAVRIEQLLQQRLKFLQQQLDALNAKDEEAACKGGDKGAPAGGKGGANPAIQQILDEMDAIRRKLYFLDETLRSGALKEQFFRGSGAPVAPFSIIPQLQQAINAQTPPPPLPQ